MNKIILKKKDSNSVQAELKELDLNYIDKIIELENKIYAGLSNKDFYACSSKEEYQEILNGKGKIIGCVSTEEDELIAMGVYIQYGYNEHNYGYDIDIQGEELLKVGQVESTIVHEKYRGNGLQNMICKILEDICINSGMKYICATVAPQNNYSVNTFIKLGYNVIAEKLKYGGLNRYILMKNL